MIRLSTQEKNSLLTPIAEGLSKHIYNMGFLNKPTITTETRSVVWITFSSEGWNSHASTEVQNYVKKVLGKYSFNVQYSMNETNQTGIGHHNKINVIFYTKDIIKNKEKIEILSRSFNGLTKFNLL